MVKLRFVCPCGERTSAGKPRPMPPPLRRQSSLTPQAQSNLARYFSVAFFIFAATTYLVFSLDMLMVPEDEPVTLISHQPRRRMEQIAGENNDASLYLRPGASGSSKRSSFPSINHHQESGNSNLVVMEEEDLEALSLERHKAETDMSVQQRANGITSSGTFDEDFADGLNSIGLAMLDEQQQSPSPKARTTGSRNTVNEIVAVTDQKSPSASTVIKENPIVLKESTQEESSQMMGGGSASTINDEMEEEPPQPTEEEEDDEDEDVAGKTAATPKPSDVPIVVATASEWRRIHTCKYGRSEKSPTLAYGTWLWRHKKGAALHDDYVKTPSDYKLRHLKSALRMVSDKTMDIKSVVSAAGEASYTLCKIDLETSIVIAWQPRVKGDALFFTRHPVSVETASDSVRDIIVEVPHALYDHTLHQGLHVFSETRARALVLSESHRCSKALMNKCTGNDGEPIRNLCYSSSSSSSSSKSSSYHNSDVAHAVQTTFHAVHEQLVEDNPSALVASLHATKSEEFIVSDGTSNLVQETSPIARFSKKLAMNLPQSTVNLCNVLPAELAASREHQVRNLVPVTEDKRHICGATNVQGRHMNGASDPCRAKVRRNGQELQASGKFLHIEQPVNLVVPVDSKSSKPVMSKQLSEAILAALEGL